MSGEITNIVPIDPSQQVEGVDAERVEKTVYSRNLAKDAIRYLEEEFKDDLNDVFWQEVHEASKERMGSATERTEQVELLPKDEPEAMTKEQRDKFLKEIIPWGQFSGSSVQRAFKKNPEALKKMAFSPLPFQVRLRRFLSSVEPK